MLKTNNIVKLRTIVIVLLPRLPTEIPIVFHNGSNYDYHFITKEPAEAFK